MNTLVNQLYLKMLIFNLKDTFQLQINHTATRIDVVPREDSVCGNVIARVAEHQDAFEGSGSEVPAVQKPSYP